MPGSGAGDHRVPCPHTGGVPPESRKSSAGVYEHLFAPSKEESFARMTSSTPRAGTAAVEVDDH